MLLNDISLDGGSSKPAHKLLVKERAKSRTETFNEESAHIKMNFIIGLCLTVAMGSV